MDGDRRPAQVEWLEVADTGRRRRRSEDTGAAPGRGDGAAIWHFALIAAPMATVISSPAEGCRPSNGLRTGDGGRGIGADAWSGRAGRRPRDRDRVCGPFDRSRSAACDHVNGFCSQRLRSSPEAAEFEAMAADASVESLQKRYGDIAACYRLLAKDREWLISTGTIEGDEPNAVRRQMRDVKSRGHKNGPGANAPRPSKYSHFKLSDRVVGTHPAPKLEIGKR